MTRKKLNTIRKNKSTKKHHIIHDRFGVRIAHHKHSGRHMPWQYTSYTVLFFLLAFVFMIVLFVGNSARAYEQISNGSIALGGFSKGPPPDSPAIITTPANLSVVEESIIKLDGLCDQGLFIELYRNSVLAGGAICRPDNSFSLYVTLVPGKNDLQTKIHDALWQYGPDSDEVIIWYNVPLPSAPILLTYTEPIQDGMFVDATLGLEYVISGGDEPYAASVNWGDGSINTVNVRQKEGKYQVDHTYKKAGQFVITINVTDERDSRALIQSVVVVHETGQEIPFVARSCQGSNCSNISGGFLRTLDWAWPAIIISGLMTASFWIGEKVAFSQRPNRLRTT
jgi:hypothetical protein